jgi:hypothetical protein
MTLVWFVIWLVADLIGDEAPLTFDPVNGWAATLILAAGLDRASQHAPEVGRKRGGLGAIARGYASERDLYVEDGRSARAARIRPAEAHRYE